MGGFGVDSGEFIINDYSNVIVVEIVGMWGLIYLIGQYVVVESILFDDIIWGKLILFFLFLFEIGLMSLQNFIVIWMSKIDGIFVFIRIFDVFDVFLKVN